MTNKHTELPWKLHEHGVGEFVVYSEYNQDAVCVFDDPDEIYCFPDGYITNGEAKANALLIVTAVNYHHRLRDLVDAAVKCHALDEFEWRKKARALLAELDNMENDNE